MTIAECGYTECFKFATWHGEEEAIQVASRWHGTVSDVAATLAASSIVELRAMLSEHELKCKTCRVSMVSMLLPLVLPDLPRPPEAACLGSSSTMVLKDATEITTVFTKPTPFSVPARPTVKREARPTYAM